MSSWLATKLNSSVGAKERLRATTTIVVVVKRLQRAATALFKP